MNEWVMLFFSKICSKEVMLHTHFPNKSHLSSRAIFLWQKVVFWGEVQLYIWAHTMWKVHYTSSYLPSNLHGGWMNLQLSPNLQFGKDLTKKKKYIYIYIQNPFVLIPFPFTVDPKRCKKLSGCHKEREERCMFLKLWVCAFVNASNIKSLDHYEYLASNWYYSWQYHP